MEQGCHNIFDVSRTKKGEKVVENIIYIYIYIIKLIFKNIIDFFFLIHQMKNMGKQINYFWGFLVWIMNIHNFKNSMILKTNYGKNIHCNLHNYTRI
jgi:hypothetical protein